MSESLNLGTLRSQARTYLMNNSIDTASLSWTDSEINGYLNEAALYTQQVTMWFEEFSNVVCTASVSTYTGPLDAYQYIRLTWDRSFLQQTNEYELDRDDPSWRLAPPNNPFRFYFPQMNQNFLISPYPTPSQTGINFAPFSRETGVVAQFTDINGNPDATYPFNQEFGVVIGFTDTNAAIAFFQPDLNANPFPLAPLNQVSASGELGELVMYSTDELNLGIAVVRYPDTMVADTDTPQLPVQCHFALVLYAVMKCFVREGEFQDIPLASQWFAAYGDWMESVLENKGRWWSTRVRSLEPFEEGSLFAQRLNAIGFPLQLDLKPSYGA